MSHTPPVDSKGSAIEGILELLIERQTKGYDEETNLDNAISAINSLTLKQVKELIGEDEPELPYDGQPETEMKNANIRSRNRLRVSQRESAERIYGGKK
jgi:hypothetical protein